MGSALLVSELLLGRGCREVLTSRSSEGRWQITRWLWRGDSPPLWTTLETLYLQTTDVSLEDTAEYYCTGSSTLGHRLATCWNDRGAWWQQLTKSHSPEGWHPVCTPPPQVLLPHFYPFTPVPDLFLWRNATLCRGWGGPVTRIPQSSKTQKARSKAFSHLATKPFLPLYKRGSLMSLQYLLLHLLLLVHKNVFFLKTEYKRIALSL